MPHSVEIVGDAIHFNGLPVAFITVETSTVRDDFVAAIEAPTVQHRLGIEILAEAKKLQVAGAIKLKHLSDIVLKMTRP